MASAQKMRLRSPTRNVRSVHITLAQETPILLLDEPTTFLDLAYQLDVLNLLTTLNRRESRTIVLVLHDINHAARYANHVIAMQNGRIVTRGAPRDIITEATLAQVFGISSVVIADPVTGTPFTRIWPCSGSGIVPERRCVHGEHLGC